MLYKSIVVEVIAPDTLAQNRKRKKAKHYITIQARTIAINANLLYNL